MEASPSLGQLTNPSLSPNLCSFPLVNDTTTASLAFAGPVQLPIPTEEPLGIIWVFSGDVCVLAETYELKKVRKKGQKKELTVTTVSKEK